MRITAGIVARGRGVEIGRGESLGIATVPVTRTAIGIAGVLSTERTLGRGIGGRLGGGGTLGIGTALAFGSSSGSGTITGTSAGEVARGIGGTDDGRGGTGAATSGVLGDAVHATDPISARTAKSLIPTSPRPANEQVFGQPTATNGKQAAPAVQSASAGLTVPEPHP